MAYTTINKPNTQFTPTIYSGTSASHAVSVGFQPDLVWLKPRSVADNHRLMNSVSGAGFYLMSNQTNAESPSGTRFTSFDADGFTLGDADAGWNQSGQTYASWNWLAGGTASSNTDGNNITSTVSANTTSGFSIVKYTGTGSASDTIGHGLGVKPAMVIMRPLSYVGAWWIVHKNLTADNVLEFNTNAQANISGFGGGGLKYSTFTTSVIGGGNGSSDSGLWNGSGQDYIAYCFAEKTGYSKFGSYTGNGNADGTFIYTGFKPSWVMIKRSSGTQAWMMYDNKRSVFNTTNDLLFANTSGAESVDNSVGIDFLSNGFKCRSADDGINSGTYIYMAFAESPIVGSNNVPANAR